MSPRAFGWTVRDASVLPDASPAPSQPRHRWTPSGSPRSAWSRFFIRSRTPEGVREQSSTPPRRSPAREIGNLFWQIFPDAGLFTTTRDYSTETLPHSTKSSTFIHRRSHPHTMSRRRIPIAATIPSVTANTDNATRFKAAATSKAAPGRLGTCENGDSSSTQPARCGSCPN
jgi:hypothetical protein